VLIGCVLGVVGGDQRVLEELMGLFRTKHGRDPDGEEVGR
jgi:hypothetical protein